MSSYSCIFTQASSFCTLWLAQAASPLRDVARMGLCVLGGRQTDRQTLPGAGAELGYGQCWQNGGEIQIPQAPSNAFWLFLRITLGLV